MLKHLIPASADCEVVFDKFLNALTRKVFVFEQTYMYEILVTWSLYTSECAGECRLPANLCKRALDVTAGVIAEATRNAGNYSADRNSSLWNRVRSVLISNPSAHQTHWDSFRGLPQSSRQMLCWIYIITIHLTIIHRRWVSHSGSNPKRQTSMMLEYKSWSHHRRLARWRKWKSCDVEEEKRRVGEWAVT